MGFRQRDPLRARDLNGFGHATAFADVPDCHLSLPALTEIGLGVESGGHNRWITQDLGDSGCGGGGRNGIVG